MGAAHGGVAGDFQHPFPFNMHTELRQLADHALAPGQATLPEPGQHSLKAGVGDVHKVAQHMDFAAGDIAAQFNARYQAHTGDGVGGALGLGQAGGSVVVAYGDGAEAAGGRQLHQFGGRQASVGGGGVEMQVNGDGHWYSRCGGVR